jgi:glutathione peroxidase
MNTRLFAVLAAAAGFLTAAVASVSLAKSPTPVHEVIKAPSSAPAKPGKDGQPVSPLDFKVKSIDGKDMDLSQYKGKVVMLVNVASKCGNTKQYKALEAIYEKYKDQGFVVLGVPANNFGGQEPGSEEEIKKFCTNNYNVTFPMTSKVSVKGDDETPLYKFLTEKKTGGDFAGDIEWNFTKFIIDRNGNVMARIFNRTAPDAPQVTKAIEQALVGKTATASAK